MFMLQKQPIYRPGTLAGVGRVIFGAAHADVCAMRIAAAAEKLILSMANLILTMAKPTAAMAKLIAARAKVHFITPKTIFRASKRVFPPGGHSAEARLQA